jgi:hypothetical protein
MRNEGVLDNLQNVGMILSIVSQHYRYSYTSCGNASGS